MTEAFDLQLFTRRLREWRLADGAESYWNERVGRLRLGTAQASTLDFVRLGLAPSAAPACPAESHVQTA
jgi:hypothetical protein